MKSVAIADMSYKNNYVFTGKFY